MPKKISSSYKKLDYLPTHADIISQYYSQISHLFTEQDVFAPSLSELTHNHRWTYCKTNQTKLRHKVGYRCHFKTTQSGYPVVVVTLHNFKHGGQTTVFNSAVEAKRDWDPIDTSKPALLPSPPPKPTDNQPTDEHKKKAKLRDYLKQWQQATPSLDHPYAIKKQLKPNHQLRCIGNALAYPLYPVNEKHPCGIQLIYPNGRKIIHGRAQAACTVIGNLTEAKTLYIVEGYATGDAIFQLASQRKRHQFAVVIALTANNLSNVARQLKQRHANKHVIICADNDCHKPEVGNAGLREGYLAALAVNAEIKIPPIPSDSNWTDWSDCWLHQPETTLTAFLEKKPISRRTYAQKHLAYYPLKQTHQLQKGISRALSHYAQTYPFCSDESTWLPEICAIVARYAVSPQTVKKTWARIKRKRFAQALRAQSLTPSDGVEALSFASITDLNQAVHRLKTQHPRAVFITNAPMGSGKTGHFMQPQFIEDELHCRAPMIITPQRALTRSVCERFQTWHYQDHRPHFSTANQDAMPSSMALTINSLIHPDFADFATTNRAVFVDEFTQVLQAITSGTVEPHLRQKTERALAHAFRRADYLYLSDADFHQIALDYVVEQAGGRPIFWLTLDETKPETNPPATYSVTPIKHNSHFAPAIYQRLMDHLAAGKRCYLATDSKRLIEQIQWQCQAKQIKLLAITADTVQFPQSVAFMQQPDHYLAQNTPQLVLVSPAIQSGLSIESNYFDCVLGGYQQTVPPQTFQQMLHRVRAQRDFELFLVNRTHRIDPALKNDQFLLTQAYLRSAEINGNRSVTFDAKTGLSTLGTITLKEHQGRVVIEGDPDHLPYETLNAKLQALANQQAEGGGHFLLIQAIQRGIQIELNPIEWTDAQRAQSRQTRQLLKKTQVEARLAAVCGENTLSEPDYQQLKRTGATNVQRSAELERYEIAKAVGKDRIDAADIHFYDQQGPSHQANYRAVLAGTDTARQQDKDDHQKGVAKVDARYQFEKVTLLQLIFLQLGINVHTGEGTFTAQQAMAVRQCIQADASLCRYITLKLRLKIQSGFADVAFVNKILKKLLGITSQRRLQRDGEQRFFIYSVQGDCFKCHQTYAIAQAA